MLQLLLCLMTCVTQRVAETFQLWTYAAALQRHGCMELRGMLAVLNLQSHTKCVLHSMVPYIGSLNSVSSNVGTTAFCHEDFELSFTECLHSVSGHTTSLIAVLRHTC